MSATQTIFTREEIIEFLQNSWNMKNIEQRLKNDRKNLVDEICTTILGKVPFQSINLMASSIEEQGGRSLEEIKARCMAGIGGLCVENNIFLWGVLDGLGFNVIKGLATVSSTVTSPGNHVIVLLSDLEQKGDQYVVDCGMGFPTFRAASLDFANESEVFHDGFLEYKYVRHEGKILRMHGKGDMIKPNNPPVEGLDFFIGRFRRFCSFDPATKPVEVIDQEQYKSIIYLTPFTASPRAVWYPEKRAVVISNNKLILENESGELVTTVLKSDQEILKAYENHFPQLKQELVEKALVEWKRQSTKS